MAGQEENQIKVPKISGEERIGLVGQAYVRAVLRRSVVSLVE